jgi:subtilase family serine protease
LIKSYIPLEFLLEWFLNSLLPYILKDVSTSRVTSEEEAIFKAQLDLIYSQFGMIYEIIFYAPWSKYDPRKNPESHADGIIGSTNSKTADLVTNQLKDLSLNQYAIGQAMTSFAPTELENVHFV